MYTTCLNEGCCYPDLYQDGNQWFDTSIKSTNCVDADENDLGMPHEPDLCADGTPSHEWVGPEYGEQICQECGSVQEVVKPQPVVAQGGAKSSAPVQTGQIAQPTGGPIVDRFNDLMEKRKQEQEERKDRTYRDSLGDLFPDMRFTGGQTNVQCPDCPAAFATVEDMMAHVAVRHTTTEDDDEDEDDV